MKNFIFSEKQNKKQKKNVVCCYCDLFMGYNILFSADAQVLPAEKL